MGALIDSKLTFRPHVNNLIRKLSHKLYMLSTIRKFLDEDKSHLIYKQMIVPYADYANFLVDCTTLDLVSKVQKMQNRGLRISRFSNMYERCSVTDLHSHFELKTLDSRRLSQLMCQMFKISQTRGIIVPVDERRTRNDSKVKIPLRDYIFKTLHKCPLFRGVWEWDYLSPEIQTSSKMSAFKSLVKNKKHRPILL